MPGPMEATTFRFIKHQKFSRCFGKKAGCIYTAHLKYFCFSGKGSVLISPHEMYPSYKTSKSEHDNQDVFTGPFGNVSPNQTSWDFNAKISPLLSWKMCPGNYDDRLVNQGLVVTKLDGSTESAGDCPNPSVDFHFPPKEFSLGLNDFITEALVRTGDVLDRLTFKVTKNDGYHEVHEVFTVGGPFGSGHDPTPKPHHYGPCQLVNMNGTVFDYDGHIFISSVGFLWACLGIPESFF